MRHFRWRPAVLLAAIFLVTASMELSYPQVAQAQVGTAAAPEASQGRGIYTSSISETLASATPGATIRYTTNGSAVTATSTLYTGPISVAPSSKGIVTIRARAFASGMAPSDEVSWSYVFPASRFGSNTAAKEGFDKNLIFAVYTDGGAAVNANTNIGAQIEMIDPTVGGGPGFSVRVAAKEFGETSVTAVRKDSIRVFLDGDFGPKKLEYPLFDGYGQGFMEPSDVIDSFELRSFSHDGGGSSWGNWYYVTDRWFKDTQLDMATPAPHGRYVQLFVNGTYRGAYHLRERFDAAFYEAYGSADKDDYDSVKLQERNGGFLFYSVNDGTDVAVKEILAESDYAAVRDRINERSMIVQGLLETLLNGSGREGEYRLVGARDPSHPDDFLFMGNDNDWEFSKLRTYPTGIRGRFWNQVGARYLDDPEFMQHVYEVTAQAVCPGGPMTTDVMLERLEFWIAQLTPSMYGENVLFGSMSKWQNLMNTTRSRFEAERGKLKTSLEAAGQLRGCDLRPQVRHLDTMLEQVGVGVNYQVEATDPDGDPITYSATGLPAGLAIDASTGLITGIPETSGVFDVEVTVGDNRDKWGIYRSSWTVNPGSANPASSPLLLNEYNAVASSGVWTGSDDAFASSDASNGGDWIELLVTEDATDLRGWSVEVWDRDRPSDHLELTERFVFSSSPVLADLSGGTIITIAESVPEDQSYDPDAGDWHLNANSSKDLSGSLLTAASRSNFDSNRHEMRVVVRNSAGQVIGQPMGETESWSALGDNVTASGVMALCSVPPVIDLVADYQEERSTSTFGQANVCAGQIQDVWALRNFLLGDVNRTGTVDASDVVAILRSDTANPEAVYSPGPGDLDKNGRTALIDAMLLAQCLASSAPLDWCGDI